MNDWRDGPIHILDFEGNSRTGIVEYGVATLLHGSVVGTKTRFCRGKAEIPPEDSRLHGIVDADTLGAAPVDEDWALFSGLRRTGPFCAHHAFVEDRLLREVWPYPGRVPDFMNDGSTTEEWRPWIDTRRLYEYLFPDLSSHQLMDLVRIFHLEPALDGLAREYCPDGRRRHHCALHDALASALLVIQIPEFPGFERIDLWWLLFNSAPSREQRESWSQRELF